MNPANQNSSIIGNDGNDSGFVPSSYGLPLGQSNSMMGSQFDSVDIASNTISENELLESGGNENQQGKSVDEQNDQLPNKRKWYHRHTLHQIQEMEAFFKEYPHPDDKQRMELSSRLGLESLQVKFWFQNKRTQMKNLFERHENSLLRAEIDKFKAENVLLSEALSNGCPNCGGPTFCLGEMPYEKNQLMLENAHQPDEVDRILEAEKLIIIETAVAAMEEFIQMAQMGEPLWLPSIYRGTNFLNEEEYMRIFRRGSEPKPQGIKIEASREIAVVIMNHHNLVEIFMDVNNWSSLFFNIVSKTITLDVLSTEGAGNLDGIIKMIYAEFQVPSPQVPIRDCYFIRYCKRVVDGVWAIVDVSLDHTPITRCRKRPSGCLIQEMPNGYSKVTWIEHIEVDDESIHSIYKPLIDSGLAFGAKRWVATLDRQCERLASALTTNVHQNDIRHMHQEGRRSVLKLAERMVISYCSGVSAAATAHQWTALRGNGSGIYDVRFMTRQSIDDPGRPHGIVLSASTSFWLPISPKTVFDFLLHENSRKKWDILSNGGDVQEVAHIAVNSRNTGNRVSFLRVNNLKSAENMLILQESSTDPTGSFLVYSAVDVPAINIVLSGGNPDHVPLLSSGFAILPDGPSSSIDGRVADSSGSLLTIAFQILVDKIPTAEVSLEAVAMVNNLIYGTIDKIKIALLSDIP